MRILTKQENELKTQDVQMARIIDSMNEKESVISELESKIRNLENDTPKSSPADMATYGNGEARKNLSEPKRNSTCGFIADKPPRCDKERKTSAPKSLKDLSTRSLPSTPVQKKDDPLASLIDYDEISERIRDLEQANSNLLDDNRTLSAGFLEKAKSHDELIDRLAEMSKDMREVKQQRLALEEQKSPDRVRKKLEKEFEKERETFRKKLKQLDEEHTKDRNKLKQYHDRCEKSKLEVIGLNKGITRKIEENAQLREEVNLLQTRTEELTEAASNARAELAQLTQIKSEFDSIKVKEKRLEGLVKRLIELEHDQRKASRDILSELSDTLHVENHLENDRVMKNEIDRLT